MGYVKRIDWIHPSCRDLVIEELAKDPDLQRRFLNGMSLQGITLSISGTGGASGERELPLMNDASNWNILKYRCLALVPVASQDDICDLLAALSSACQESSDAWKTNQLRTIIAAVCAAARDKWNASAEFISYVTLATYFTATILTDPFLRPPNLESSWNNLIEGMRESLLRAENRHPLEPDQALTWAKFAKVVQDNEPRFLLAIGFPEKFRGDLARLVVMVDQEVEADFVLDSASVCDEEADRIASMKEVVDILTNLTVRNQSKKTTYDDSEDENSELKILNDNLLKLSERLRRRIEYLKETSIELTPPEPDYDDEGRESDGEQSFDINGLFSDL